MASTIARACLRMIFDCGDFVSATAIIAWSIFVFDSMAGFFLLPVHWVHIRGQGNFATLHRLSPFLANGRPMATPT